MNLQAPGAAEKTMSPRSKLGGSVAVVVSHSTDWSWRVWPPAVPGRLTGSFWLYRHPMHSCVAMYDDQVSRYLTVIMYYLAAKWNVNYHC